MLGCALHARLRYQAAAVARPRRPAANHRVTEHRLVLDGAMVRRLLGHVISGRLEVVLHETGHEVRVRDKRGILLMPELAHAESCGHDRKLETDGQPSHRRHGRGGPYPPPRQAVRPPRAFRRRGILFCRSAERSTELVSGVIAAAGTVPCSSGRLQRKTVDYPSRFPALPKGGPNRFRI